jgi:hypothetical protein
MLALKTVTYVTDICEPGHMEAGSFLTLAVNIRNVSTKTYVLPGEAHDVRMPVFRADFTVKRVDNRQRGRLVPFRKRRGHE